ncbi:ferrochelatase [Mariniphaga anaerophila]|uniref:Ferrochelatase n=1 Tax=Mariniphaga anaerophila TaxID=1484053 RepID=A0A1M5CUP1_9BACT|nr:ferrochelatase [Mariniphaga anaerophila]SHF58471.1 ferrochelatase [Mariniphaga anaerophila]
MNNDKTAVLLMNVGSPDEPEIGAVWRYLTEFLNDKRVIDLPWLLRKFLVNFIIIPFRVKNSTRLYKLLWTEKGSPLIFHSFEMKQKLQIKLEDKFEVFVAMRYQNPDYKRIICQIREQGFKKLILFPLYPQYAQSTTETTVVAVKQELERQNSNIELKVINQFYDNPQFIQAFAEQGRKYNLADYDHVIFSYHGLPNRHLENSHPDIKATQCSCQNSIPEYGKNCYRATCYATTRLLAKELGLKKENYTVSFQSRLDKNWMEPFTDNVMLQKLQEGKKRILVFAPAFVTDCLETIIEIGDEYREIFLENGGEKLQLVESLNAEPAWIDTMATLVLEEANKSF